MVDQSILTSLEQVVNHEEKSNRTDRGQLARDGRRR